MNLKQTLLASCAVAIAVTSCKEPAKDYPGLDMTAMDTSVSP
nr:hypothetical protein [Nonlabens ulvanivorans]